MEKVWLDNYMDGVPKEVDPSAYKNIADLIQQAFSKYADKPAFYNMGTTLTYAEMKEKSQSFASYLQNDLGLPEKSRVAIMLPNLLQYPIALFGILQANMTVVNINPMYTERELKHQLNDSGADTILILEKAAPLLNNIYKETNLKHVILSDFTDQLGAAADSAKEPTLELPGVEVTTFNHTLLKGDAGQYKLPTMDFDSIAYLQYTGGTTGVSKGAVLTHGNIVNNVLQARTWISPVTSEGNEVVITALPLYHIFSLTANCMNFSSFGSLNVLITNPMDMPGFVNELKKFQFTAISGVNTLFNGLLHTPGFDELDFSKLTIALGGGTAIQKPVADAWHKVTGVCIQEAYGLTETSPAATMNRVDLQEFNGTVGLPLASTEFSIRNDEGQEVALGEAGEICIKGPQVMQGYWQRPEETAKVMTDDGFLKTGDVGYMTETGHVKLVDRKKDMILVSGFNVYPNEIEEVVGGHPMILEAAAVGVPDDKSGEVVKIFVVKKDPALTEDAVIEYCRKEMTGYKVPKFVDFIEQLPKSAVGKILRRELRS